MLVYKLEETIEYVKNKSTFQEKYKLYGVNKRILRIKNEKFSGYYFYTN